MAELNADLRDKFLEVMDLGVAAMSKVVVAYRERRTRERDINWLALQAGKEYGAAVQHSRSRLGRVPGGSPKEIIKCLSDSIEEMEHYEGYMEVLNWYLKGEPCPVTDMYEYCSIEAYRHYGYGPYELVKDRWPYHSEFFSGWQNLANEGSAWSKGMLVACREGGGADFHYLMSQISPDDEFLRRIAHVEKKIAEEELHHGPELIDRLCRESPSEEEIASTLERVTRLRIMAMRERNEQFLSPLSSREMSQIEADFMAKRFEPMTVFRAAAL